MFESLKKKFSNLFKKEESVITKEKKKPSNKQIKGIKKIRNKKVEKNTSEDIEKNPNKENSFVEEKHLDNIDDTPKEDGFFEKIKKKLTHSKLTQEEFDEAFIDLEIDLLENNVALEAVDSIKSVLEKNLIDKKIKKSEITNSIINSLKEAINNLLIEPPTFKDLVKKIKDSKKPYKILFFGINGSGKTTSIAKLAYKLKKEKISVVLAAADTFRAASIEQIQKHGERIGVPVISHEYGTDPASVAFDAYQYAKKNNIQVVLIDTAGRMYNQPNLLREMEKIIKISQPDMKIFVGESITGNDATNQAKTFNNQFGIDGIILSKADIDEKAGTILSVSQVTGKPIIFLGTGQEYGSLDEFKKSTILGKLGF